MQVVSKTCLPSAAAGFAPPAALCVAAACGAGALCGAAALCGAPACVGAAATCGFCACGFAAGSLNFAPDWLAMNTTARAISSSVSEGLPPFGGIAPLPLIA